MLDIVARASELDERLSGDFIPSRTERASDVVDTRLSAWCRVVAKGHSPLFEQRLAWDGLDIERVRAVLDDVRLAPGAELPAWAHLLDAVLGAASTSAPPRSAIAGEPLPFEELLAPFLVVARQRLVEQAGADYELLSDEAHIALERDLLKELTKTAGRAFQVEFSLAVFEARSPMTRLMGELRNSDDRTLYQSFVEEMLGGEIVAFFETYPVLARLLAHITHLWVDATSEFLHRLATDWDTLEQTFAGSDALTRVVGVGTGLSDPHRGRRSVIALTFASGKRVVYKPKDLGVDLAFQKLLSWMNEHGLRLPLKVLTLINRGSHGWVEFVPPLRCQNAEQAERYYQRAGTLLCLAYVLAGTDFHHDNLIANGEHPILVDLEALMQHRAHLEPLIGLPEAQQLAHEMIATSVLHTGFLPNWQIDRAAQRAYDVSGLRGPDEMEFDTVADCWERINTDRMDLRSKPIKIEVPAEYASQPGIRLRLADHQDAVLAGFEECYRFLLDHRAALLAPDSPLRELEPQQLRLIYRNTKVYGALLEQLLAPVHLRDGADWSIQLEALGVAVMPARENAGTAPRSSWWPVFAEERRAMLQMDIPFFATRADSDSFALPSGARIEGCFREPSFNRVIERLQSLGAHDLERQLGFIAGSFYALSAREPTSSSVPHDVSDDVLTPHELVAQALRIAETIGGHTIRAKDGSASWIVPQYMSWAERYQLQQIGFDLYSGVCGIALFLAAVERVTGGAGYRELTFGALQPLRSTLERYGSRVATEMGIGAATGVGSVVYTLTAVSRFLDDPELLSDATHAALSIDFTQIANDEALDIFDGSAGALLGLLALHSVKPNQGVLDRAVACGNRLLERRVVTSNGHRTWPGFSPKPLTGFSHGAAGIAYALLRLYGVTGDVRYREAASEAIAYEDEQLIADLGNWRDLRSDTPNDCRVSWCHGAPGIGLARLAGLPWLDTAEIRQDLSVALKRTEQEGVQTIDHLCCGNMGRVDILLAAARHLSDARLTQVAERAAAQIVARAERTGAFALDPILPRQVQHFGFFQGTAGLGYSLLRVAYPGQLPSVLLWQP